MKALVYHGPRHEEAYGILAALAERGLGSGRRAA